MGQANSAIVWPLPSSQTSLIYPIFQRSAQGKTITSCTKSGMQKNREAGRLDSDWDKSKIGGNKIGSTTKVPCHLACCITCPREVPLFFPKHDKLSITYEGHVQLVKTLLCTDTLVESSYLASHLMFDILIRYTVYSTHVFYCIF